MPLLYVKRCNLRCLGHLIRMLPSYLLGDTLQKISQLAREHLWGIFSKVLSVVVEPSLYWSCAWNLFLLPWSNHGRAVHLCPVIRRIYRYQPLLLSTTGICHTWLCPYMMVPFLCFYTELLMEAPASGGCSPPIPQSKLSLMLSTYTFSLQILLGFSYSWAQPNHDS